MEFQKQDFKYNINPIASKVAATRLSYNNDDFLHYLRDLNFTSKAPVLKPYFLFCELFKEIFDVSSIIQAFPLIEPKTNDNFFNSAQAVYENIHNVKIKKYYINIDFCNHRRLVPTLYVQPNNYSKKKVDHIPKSDLFYGVTHFNTTHNDNFSYNCINAILKLVKLGIQYSNKYIIIGFNTIIQFNDVLCLLMAHYDVKIYQATYDSYVNIMFHVNAVNPIVAVIDGILKTPNVGSFVEPVPAMIDTLCDTIHNNVFKIKHSNPLSYIVNTLCINKFPLINYDALLDNYFKPIQRYLGKDSVYFHTCPFIKNYLKEKGKSKNKFVFVGVDNLDNYVGRFYGIFLKYKYICIQHIHLDPLLFLKKYKNEIMYDILHECPSYILVQNVR